METPEIPQRFPCWVKAVYSWGGETKRDLGFIEGDLIECLNAGDGSWWMGRLRRDKRMVGLFPSNFVKVLSADFQPTPRPASSPTPSRPSGSASIPGSPQGSAPTTPVPQKAKSIFRRPFTAYAAAGSPNPLAAARELERNSPKGTPSPTGSVVKTSSRLPYASMKKRQEVTPTPSPKPYRPPSPKIPAPIPRGTSPRPHADMQSSHSRTPSRLASRLDSESLSEQSRAVSMTSHSHLYDESRSQSRSTAPVQDGYFCPQEESSRAPSPLPHREFSRAPSPARLQSYAEEISPPPHRGYAREHSPSSHQDYSREVFPSEHQAYIEETSHMPRYSGEGSSPLPPPPPAHRIPYVRHDPPDQVTIESNQRYVSSQSYAPTYDTPRTQSPAPSEQLSGYTPSPLRDAMKDVMNSLEGMSLSRSNSQALSKSISNPWSPEAFDEIYSASLREVRRKTMSEADYMEEPKIQVAQVQTMQKPQVSVARYQSDPRLDGFVERMENEASLWSWQDGLKKDHPDRNGHSNMPISPQRPLHSRDGHSTSTHQENDLDDIYEGNSRQDFPRHKPSLSRSTTNASQNHSRTHHSIHDVSRQTLHRSSTAVSSVTTASSAAHSSATNQSHTTQMTSQSLMSGYSAGGFSATSAGSLARRKFSRSGSVKSLSRPASAMEVIRPGTAVSATSAHSSHASGREQQAHIGCQPIEPMTESESASLPLKKKRSGFFRKILDSAKTSAATARSNVASANMSRPISVQSGSIPNGITSISGGTAPASIASDMGLRDGTDWVRMRRDVNRSNSLSRNERNERAERCEMMDMVVMSPVDILQEVEGDENEYGARVEDVSDFTACNHMLVDKNARFVNNLPPLVNSVSLAQGYLCRPYRGNVQRLRAIFTWISERITWEEDFDGVIDTRRVIQTRRGCSEEIALLVAEMCAAVGVHAEVVRGYLKPPGEALRQNLNETAARPNHWWNTVLIDGEWRIMDCALAGPSHPRRSDYSSVGNQVADGWWFLARPTEICYTHVPLLPEQQHICPSLPHDVLMALPVASPACFKYRLRMWDFDTSLLHLDGLEMAHIRLVVPDDVECIAEVEARAFARDEDGDYFESGDMVKKRSLAQGEYVSCGTTTFKRYTIKAILPSSTGTISLSSQATLKIYAGHRGLMQSVNSNPYPLALSLPLSHHGENPDYDFFTRHPTPHALRHELYVTGPLCKRLVHNSTFVFGVRQYFASATGTPPPLDRRPSSPTTTTASTFATRPTSALSRAPSALSIASISVSGSAYSNPSEAGSDGSQQQADKPAKLAIQSPSGKIMKMSRKTETGRRLEAQDDGTVRVGSLWETIVKIGERGVWRGLVLADRSARWCVFAEWECV